LRPSFEVRDQAALISALPTTKRWLGVRSRRWHLSRNEAEVLGLDREVTISPVKFVLGGGLEGAYGGPWSLVGSGRPQALPEHKLTDPIARRSVQRPPALGRMYRNKRHIRNRCHG
jgi:hypothetical protein